MSIGIDCGQGGAICVLSAGSPTFFDISDINMVQFYTDHEVAIEKQVALPRQKGAGKTMYEFGRLVGHLEAYGLSTTIVRPQEWYKMYKIPSGMEYKKRKHKTAEIISSIYPRFTELFYGPRGGLIDGRTDALAIAHWLETTSAS